MKWYKNLKVECGKVKMYIINPNENPKETKQSSIAYSPNKGDKMES